MEIKLLPEAELELAKSLAEYDGIGAARRTFRSEIERVFAQIERFPLSGSQYGSMRRCLLEAYPFVVIYKVYARHLTVFAVMHTSRDPDYWRSRLPKK